MRSSRLIALVLAGVAAAAAAQAPAPPRPDLVYLPKWGRYQEVHTLPAVVRAMVGEGD